MNMDNTNQSMPRQPQPGKNAQIGFHAGLNFIALIIPGPEFFNTAFKPAFYIN